ncbi:MAG TPA: N-acetylmuramoyl-L-alanine amidase [Steroidobacteraceae bacterium]|jgi:N-acetylmuramoyl-L-alanine amidase|nr:N-acetylmuramoyl-L-alanine amidase [Steroidobacteraceae bacterium]
MFKLRPLLALFVLALGAGRAWTASVSVEDIRLWAGPDSTRVVFDLSGPVDHTLLTLQDPDRIVVDIDAARLSDSIHSLPDGRGFVKQLRGALQADGDYRIVMDLTAPANAHSFNVQPNGPYGHRLVVDLTPDPSNGASSAARPPVAVKSTDDMHGREVVIAVDAGHGGPDSGAIGKRGTFEKNVTLAIAKRLAERINREPGMRAVLTRDGDYFIPLRERIIKARKYQADMFVSVHADAFRDRSVAGSSVYVLSARGASDEAARWLAESENASDLIGGVSLQDKDDVLASVLLDLSQGASMSASIDAAERVLLQLDRVGNVRRPAVQHAGFVVLKSPDIPSLLVETAFITNPGEESKLGNSRHQQLLADAIHQGVREYFYANPPPGTQIAKLRLQNKGEAVVASTVSQERTVGTSQ